jgi:transcription elongation factor Elf1
MSKINCPYCGKVIEEGLKNCPNCGQSLEENIPATTSEEGFDDYEEMSPTEFANNAMQRVSSIMDKATDITCTFAQVMNSANEMKMEIARLDHQLDAFIAQTDANLERFKRAAPIIEKQLENASERIDRITDKILSNSDSDLTPESLQKQSILIDMMTQANDSFNNMVMKLLTL